MERVEKAGRIEHPGDSFETLGGRFQAAGGEIRVDLVAPDVEFPEGNLVPAHLAPGGFRLLPDVVEVPQEAEEGAINDMPVGSRQGADIFPLG